MKSRAKSIILFSYNPVPTDEYTTVEGSALRFWRMAQALKGFGCTDITIAVWSKFPQTVKEAEGIKITNFTDDPAELKSLVSGVDVAVFTCAMGSLSTAIYDAISEETKIITDAYSPMYVEFLTKSPDKKEDDQLTSHYREFADAFSRILIGADHILIGNDNQKHFYRGVMGGLNELLKHDDSRFVLLPAYVEKDKKVTKRTTVDGKIKILWFGGVYPWFDIADIVSAFNDERVSKRATLTIVGGSNPFYPKDNMRYNGKYLQAVEVAEKNRLIQDGTISFEDWVDYDKRVEVFNDYDAAISVNGLSIENDYSFRLRVADLAGNGVPVITNGGDVLGEKLIEEKAAFKVDISSVDKIVEELEDILKSPKKIETARKILRNELYEKLHIEGNIGGLVSAIESDYRNDFRGDRVDKLDQTKKQSSVLRSLSLSDLENVSTKNIAKVFIQRLKNSLKKVLRFSTGKKK